MTIRAFLSLALFAILCKALSLQQECEVGTDGSCIDDSCVDNHEKCDLWRTMGKSDAKLFLVYILSLRTFFSKQLMASC